MSHEASINNNIYRVWLQPHPEKSSILQVNQLMRHKNAAFTMITMQQTFLEMYPQINDIQFWYKTENDMTKLTHSLWHQIKQQSNSKSQYTIYYNVTSYKKDVDKKPQKCGMLLHIYIYLSRLDLLSFLYMFAFIVLYLSRL